MGKMPCGQKCLYKFNAEETGQSGTVKASHFTPVKRYEDYLTFDFEPINGGQGCKTKGYSTSGVWYAHYDYGTNYCNLRNLLDGIGVSSAQGFTETTSVDVCTQYDQLDCS